MTIPNITAFTGQLPVQGDPATFPARADALFLWLVQNYAPESNVAINGINAALNTDATVLDALTALQARAAIAPTAGASAAYTLTTTIPVTSYGANQLYRAAIDRPSSGGDTLDVDGVGPLPIKKYDATNTLVPISPGDLLQGDVVTFICTGTVFIPAITGTRIQQGSWVPRFTDGATLAGVPATVTASGKYSRIGDRVFVDINISNIDTSGMTLGWTPVITDLPFPIAAGGLEVYAPCFMINFGSSDRTRFVARPQINTDRFVLEYGGNSTFVLSMLTAGAWVKGQLNYVTDAP